MNPRRAASIVVWLIGPAFLGVGAWLALGSPKADIPKGQINLVPIEQVHRGPWRTPLRDASESIVGGMQRPCSECHKLFAPSPVEARTLVQHKGITINHGMNTRCLNCHDGTDRDKLVLHDGTLVNFDQAPRLCSQCHGTVFRDWQRGAHGKTMGSWDVASGKQRRLDCNECHDPHSPAFPTLSPLPGPSTMRMGDQSRSEAPAHRHAPLQRWSSGTPEPSGTPEHNEHSESGSPAADHKEPSR